MTATITAYELKLALLQYFRFRRGWICVDEYKNKDIIADTGREIIEVEVKISKSDLIRERKKRYKHYEFKNGDAYNNSYKNIPNRFYFCVPLELAKDAERFAEGVNPNYGVISFDLDGFERFYKLFPAHWYKCLVVTKSAKPIHKEYDSNQWRGVAKRASTKLITLMEKRVKTELKCGK
jgi:hypothetical protein